MKSSSIYYHQSPESASKASKDSSIEQMVLAAASNRKRGKYFLVTKAEVEMGVVFFVIAYIFRKQD